MQRHQDWLREAAAELRAAVALAELGHHAWSCFTAQQGAEKALKAALEWSRRPRFGHNLLELLEELGDRGVLRDACARLNRYYVTTRYPDAFPSGVPAEQFTSSDAQQALADARSIIDHVAALLR